MSLLAGRTVTGVDGGPAHAVAARLLAALGLDPAPGGGRGASAVGRAGASLGALAPSDPTPPGAQWARSGLLALTGWPDAPPTLPAVDHLAGVQGLLAAVDLLGRAWGRTPAVDTAVVVERAALGGLRRAGATSCGGATRLVPSADGWVAVCLARPDDVALVPAWLGVAEEPDPWATVVRAVARRPTVEVVEDAAQLGLAVAAVPADATRAPDDEQALARRGAAGLAPLHVHPLGVPGVVATRPLVVDLSSLWAGPLCAHLLGLAGARVVKVESTRRPDGARRGPAAFYRTLHAGHEAVALDFTSPVGRDRLRALLEVADVVIEGSRPRALEQLDIEPAAVLAAHPGATWVSITAYGRNGPWRQRVGFGDDVAAAAGLVAGPVGAPVFCGDALADPLAGLVATAGVLASWLGGGGVLVDVALRDAAASLAAGPTLAGVVVAPPGADGRSHVVDLDGTRTPVAAPRPRPVPVAPAPGLGAHTDRLLAELC